MQRVKADHPYEVPGVVVTPIVDGNPEYLAWIEVETANGEATSAEQR
jgi:periplasmic divalent cation tolerance protein